MDITPEIIATKIFGAEPYEDWNNGTLGFKGWRFDVENDNLRWHPGLPTFKGSEWTGPLLERASNIAEAYQVRFRESYIVYEGGNSTERDYYFDLWPKGRKSTFGVSGKNASLNLAIAEAILEAEK